MQKVAEGCKNGDCDRIAMSKSPLTSNVYMYQIKKWLFVAYGSPYQGFPYYVVYDFTPLV